MVRTPDELHAAAAERAEIYAAADSAPFKVTAKLVAPIAGVLPWISLDGLLAWAVLKDLTGYEIYNFQGAPADEQVELPLPLTEHTTDVGHNYWAASFAVYESADSVVRYRKRWDEEHDHVVDFRGKRERVQTDGLFFKALDLPCVVRSMPELTFYGHGDIAEVNRLLSVFILRIGKLRGHGWGRVSSWLVVPWHEDWSCWWHGQPMRAIPTEAVSIEHEWCYRTEYCGFRPPYWAPQNQTLCVVP